MGSVAMHFSVTLSKDCHFIHEAWESIGLHHILPLLRMCSSSIKLLLLCTQWAITAAFMNVHAGQNLMYRKELVEWVEKETPQFQTKYVGFKGVFPGDSIAPISQTRVCYKTSCHPLLATLLLTLFQITESVRILTTEQCFFCSIKSTEVCQHNFHANCCLLAIRLEAEWEISSTISSSLLNTKDKTSCSHRGHW